MFDEENLEVRRLNLSLRVDGVRRHALREHQQPQPPPPTPTGPRPPRIFQAAIDASIDGDTVLVTNGVYDSGGMAVYGNMTNRVAITKPITVRSVHGPSETVIKGQGPEATAPCDACI